MADSFENVLETELESLQAIYIHELTYSRNPDGTINTIELLLHPATGHDTTKQYVCMTLVFRLSSEYPDETPVIEIRNPRGLGEEEVTSLVEDMYVKAEDMKGDPMLYTLIEMAKDSLTEGNIPHCPCVVCLEHFNSKNSFHRTACYHYFHTCCLYKYLLHTKSQMEEEEKEAAERKHAEANSSDKDKAKGIMCPVCRSPLDDESLGVMCSQEELEQDEKTEKFVIPPELREKQLEMAQLYEQQKAKGGIIDLEHERNKYLLNPEDRMPIRSQAQVPMAAEVSTSRSPRKQDTKIGGNHTSSSQQNKNKGRGRGRGNSRGPQERFNQTKSRPGFVDDRVDRSSVGNARKEENKVERKEFIEGKEAVREDSKNEREFKRIEKIERNDPSSEESEIKGRSEYGESGRRLGSDNETLTSGNPDYSSEDSPKQKDWRSDRYRSTQNEYKGFSSRGRGSRGQGGQDRRPQHSSQYKEKESIHYKDRDNYQEERRDMNKKERDEKTGLKGKEDQRVESLRDLDDDSSSCTSERSHGFKEGPVEQRIGGGRYGNSTGGGNNMVRNQERYFQNDKKGTSGFERERDYHPHEYERSDRRGEERGRWEYGDRRSGSYRRGDNGYSGRGSEPGNKGSKFNDRRSGYSDKSYVRHERSHDHHHTYPSQHHHHHHNRQGQERKRADQPARDAQEIVSPRDENIEDSGTTGASGADTTSEAGTQDDDEANVLHQSHGSPWHKQESDYSRNMANFSRKATDNSRKMKDSFKKANYDTYRSYNHNEYRYSYDKSEMPVNKKSSLEENEDMLYKHDHYFITSKSHDSENWEDEIDMYAFERHLIRPECLAEYDKQVASHKERYHDMSKDRDEPRNVIADKNKHIMIEEDHRKDIEFKTKSLAQEKKKSETDISFQENPLSRMEVTNPEISLSLKEITNLEKLPSQEEYIYQRRPISHKEAASTIKFVLQLFREEHARNNLNPGITDNTDISIPSQQPAARFEQSDNLVSKFKRKNPIADKCNGNSTLNGSISKGCVPYTHFNNLDTSGNLVKETQNKPAHCISRSHVSSVENLTKTEQIFTEDGHSKCDSSATKKSGNSSTCKSKGASTREGEDGTQVSSSQNMADRDGLLMNSKPLLDNLSVSSTESLLLAVTGKDKGSHHMDASSKNCLHKYGSTLPSDKSTLHKDESVFYKDESASRTDHSTLEKYENTHSLGKSILHQVKSQTVTKNYKKLPPLKFPRKNERRGSKDSSVGTISRPTSPGEGPPTSEASNPISQVGELPAVGGQNTEINESLRVSDTSIPPLQTTSAMFNNWLPSCASDLSAAFLNSYLTGYWSNTNLVNPTENGLGFNPNLGNASGIGLGLNPNLVSVAGNGLGLHPNLVSVAGNGLNLNPNLISATGYDLGLNSNILGIENYIIGNAGNFVTNDLCYLNSMNAHSVSGYSNTNNNARSMDDTEPSAGGSGITE